MAIEDFIEGLKTTLEAGNEDKLINEYCYYPEGLAPDDLELLKTLSASCFDGFYGKAVSITYQRFAELPPHRQERYAGSALGEHFEYILYFHYADAAQETDNSAPVGKVNGAYKILP